MLHSRVGRRLRDALAFIFSIFVRSTGWCLQLTKVAYPSGL